MTEGTHQTPPRDSAQVWPLLYPGESDAHFELGTRKDFCPRFPFLTRSVTRTYRP